MLHSLVEKLVHLPENTMVLQYHGSFVRTDFEPVKVQSGRGKGGSIYLELAPCRPLKQALTPPPPSLSRPPCLSNLLAPPSRRTYTYSEPQLYSQNSGGSYFDTQGGSSQVSTVVTSHGMTNNGGGSTGGMSMGMAGGQVISSSSGAYLMDNAGPHPATQTARASPATLQWLLDNYETAEGVSLPRSTLYNHYLRHCQEQKLDPVNAASFGKLIRSIFMGLRTRRLGTRSLTVAPQTITQVGGSTILERQSRQSLHRASTTSSSLAILDVVVNLQFSLIEKLWQTFWRYSPPDTVEGATVTENRNEAVLKWMSTCDHLMYQALVEILIPDVLRPIPSALTQAIRNFAKSLEGWLSNAMNAISQRMIQTKIAAVSAFAQTLRRYTSLNHLAQAARPNSSEWSRLSYVAFIHPCVDPWFVLPVPVQEQASWVCQCEEGVVQHLEQDFKATLQQQSSLEQWAAWLDNVVTQVLKPYEHRPSFPRAARQFLLKWSFYRSGKDFRIQRVNETSGMDSDLEEDTEESGEPLAKREKPEHEVIQVIQVGGLEDGSHPVVGVVQQSVLHSLPQPLQDHTEHILTPSVGTPTIRHCSTTGNTYASV
ncbi:hypothetical protein GOODEAATRI_003204 [Goodea atripinnis]|uniref:Transcription factor RFX3 n=1 Tax=Goodea atripinnis TaxID=208336 RepID=A0ABV0NHG8_9TELE